MDEVKNNEDGKLVLVTAINPTPAGEGKTTTSVGVSQGVKTNLERKQSVLFVSHLLDHVLVSKVEQPVVDMHRLYQLEDLNLHFTGIFMRSHLQTTY